jgi:hypothetical protein
MPDPKPKPSADRNIAVTAGTNPNTTNPKVTPRPALTAFGPKITFVARSYAPFESFGMPQPLPGFEGDGVREPSTDMHATARITSVAQLLTDKNTVQFLAFSSESAWPAIPFKHDQYSYWPEIVPHLQVTATAQPHVDGEFGVDEHDMFKINMHHSGKVPLMHPQFITPDIDLYTEFLLTLGADGSLHIATAMYGDAFPSAEAFARFGDGRAVMLHHFETSGSADFGPGTMLWGDSKRPMGSTTVVIPPTRPT